MNIRPEAHKLCLLVMIGVRADGRKELVARANGYREPAKSWADLLRDCAGRGMTPRCWSSATARWGSGARCGRSCPRGGEGRCWFHRTADVVAAPPK